MKVKQTRTCVNEKNCTKGNRDCIKAEETRLGSQGISCLSLFWYEVVDAHFDGSRKEFWAFIGRREKGTCKKKSITSLKSNTGPCFKSSNAL